MPPEKIKTGFYSTFFLEPQTSGELGPVINLWPLNRYLRKHYFKMDSLSKVTNLVQLGDWAISIDLTEAYLQVPLHVANSRKFLRLCIQGKAYQFQCLCFGSTQAISHNCNSNTSTFPNANLRLEVYVDDWFLVNQIREMLMRDKKSVQSPSKTRFLIKLEKSTLSPSQSIT